MAGGQERLIRFAPGRQPVSRGSGLGTNTEIHAEHGADPAFLLAKPVYSAWK